MSYLDDYIGGKLSENDIKTIFDRDDKNQDASMHEKYGLLREEYADYKSGTRNMAFYVFKRKMPRSIYRLWPGCYVKFAFQYDLAEPHYEYGWVDVVDGRVGMVRIQCDDTYQGNRALTVRIIDVMEILPYKERPLVYYKSMICGDCALCKREENSFPENCPQFCFFNAILNKQIADNQFLSLYNKEVK